MVFGYNGLERFSIRVPGAITLGPGVMVPPGTGNWAGNAYQLFGTGFGPQISWLFPLDLLAPAAGLAACGERARQRSAQILPHHWVWAGRSSGAVRVTDFRGR